jgi:hypothetical protein
VSTKIGEISLEFLCTIDKIVNMEKPSGPTLDREKDSHVECLLFTWDVRACLFMDYYDAIYVFLHFFLFFLILHVLSE